MLTGFRHTLASKQESLIKFDIFKNFFSKTQIVFFFLSEKGNAQAKF